MSRSLAPAVVLAMLCASAQAQPNEPSPDDIGSHEQYLKLYEQSQATSYQLFLTIYDRWLESNPNSARAAVERCQFVNLAATDSDAEQGEDVAAETKDDCSAQLVERFPEVPRVVQFRLDQLWGESAIELGEKIVAKRSLEWSPKQSARFFKSLAFAYFAQRDLGQAVYAAGVAHELDPALDLSIIFASELKRQGRIREAAAAIAKAGIGDRHDVYQKLSLLLECNAFSEALVFIEAMQSRRMHVSPLQHARALEGVGRTEAARKLYASLTDQEWNRERGLLRLLYIDLAGEDRARAITSYEALRDVGFQADPFLRHRLALLRKFPSAPWHLRDGLGLLGLLGLGLFILVLPCCVIFPVHYIGLVRNQRAESSESRWSLWQLWGVSAAYLMASTCATYLFSYAELAEIFSDNPQAEPSRSEIARATLWNCVLTSIAVLAWLRRGDLARVFRSSWSPQRIALSTLGWVLLIGLVQVVAAAGMRALGWSPNDAMLALGLTTRDALKAVLNEYGAPLFFPLVVLLVPISEELLFRSVWLGVGARFIPVGFANLLQAGLFTMLHDEPMRYPALLMLALIAGRITRRSGGLLPAICLHVAVNLLATLVIYAGLGERPAEAAPKPAEGIFKTLDTEALVLACKNADLGRCSDAAERYEKKGDYPGSAAFYQEACDGGLSSACIRLGARYAKGVHVEPDPGRAELLFERACALGAGGGCNQRAVLREQANDLASAARLYEKACDLDRPEGCTNLARLYRDGQGVTKDVNQSTRLFKLACDLGFAGGCDALGAR